MKNVFLSLLLYAVWLSEGFAETVILRSADHPNFTRVALDLARPEEVSVKQEGRRIAVKLPNNFTVESADKFFDRITRARILTFYPMAEGKGFQLDLACDCSFKSFVAGSKTMVIDILDEPSERLDDRTATMQRSRFERVKDISLGFTHDQNATRKSDPPNLSNVGENLATLRLLDALDLVQETQSNTDGNSISDEANDSEQITFRSLPVLQNRAVLQVEQEGSLDVQECKELAELDPVTWPKYENAGEFLSDRRMALVSGSDDFNDDAARELARSYLSLSMGAEAWAILGTLRDPTKVDLLFLKLARFLDEEDKLGSLEWLEAIASCPELRLWQVLYDSNADKLEGVLQQMSTDHIKDLRSQFEAWPSALQGVFAPRLAAAFFELGDADIASFTLRKSEGKPVITNGERELLAAKISGKQGKMEQAISILKPVVASDVDGAPAAVISIADLKARKGDPLEPPEKAALVTYQEELKGTKIEPELLRARIVAGIQAGEFEAVISLIEDYSELVRASKVNVVLDELGVKISKIPSDAEFLKEAVSLPVKNFNAFAEDIQQQIRKRVAELGFEDLALQLGQRTARLREVETRAGVSSVAKARDVDEDIAETAASEVLVAAKKTELAGEESEETDERLLDSSTRKQKPQTVRNASPLAEAIDQTQLVLDGMADLKSQLSELGL